MRLHASVGPNPRVVKMFLAEKGLEVEFVAVDLRDGENRREPYTSVNPAGQTPALELDDGSNLTETTAICEYLEEPHPSPPLIGTAAQERALTRMWTRRADLKAIARDGLEWFEGHFQGPWIAGERFTLADIVLFAFLDFGAAVGQPLDAAFGKLSEWFARVKARPSAAASA